MSDKSLQQKKIIIITSLLLTTFIKTPHLMANKLLYFTYSNDTTAGYE